MQFQIKFLHHQEPEFSELYVTELRWEADKFDLGHCEFEVPMGKHLSYRHKGEKRIREVPAHKWL